MSLHSGWGLVGNAAGLTPITCTMRFVSQKLGSPHILNSGFPRQWQLLLSFYRNSERIQLVVAIRALAFDAGVG